MRGGERSQAPLAPPRSYVEATRVTIGCTFFLLFSSKQERDYLRTGIDEVTARLVIVTDVKSTLPTQTPGWKKNTIDID